MLKQRYAQGSVAGLEDSDCLGGMIAEVMVAILEPSSANEDGYAGSQGGFEIGLKRAWGGEIDQDVDFLRQRRRIAAPANASVKHLASRRDSARDLPPHATSSADDSDSKHKSGRIPPHPWKQDQFKIFNFDFTDISMNFPKFIASKIIHPRASYSGHTFEFAKDI
jgi:hypothetical protein